MQTAIKGILLVAGAYVATLVTALIASLIVMTIIGSQTCSALSQALPILWIVIALLFLGSVAGVVIAVWKLLTSTAGRVVFGGGYAAVMVITYLVIALGLLAGFNC